MDQLVDRVAWITGAGSGIGLALAHRLAAEKMKLVLVDVDADRVAAAEAALRGTTRVLALRADVAKAEDVDAAAKQALDAFGGVQLIVNNAGIGGRARPLWKTTESEWTHMLDVNLMGVVRGIRALLPPLLDSKQPGHIVNTASIAGLTSNPYLGAYSAAKHGVVALSECLAKELELAGANVGVSVACPGFVKTNISLSSTNNENEKRSAIADAFDAMIAAGIAPEIVADAIVDAIKAPRFYILTHAEMTKQIEYRMRQILDGKQPGIDPRLRSIFAKQS